MHSLLLHLYGKAVFLVAIKLFLDAGHNPRNPNAGAEANGLREQDVTYAVTEALARLLLANGNFEVRRSRNTPTEILGTNTGESLAARVNAANAWGADYFISIHTNASEIITATGAEGYVYRVGNAATPLAAEIVAGIAEQVGFGDRGLFSRPTLYVLRKTAMPAMLIEIGFLTNPAEAAVMEFDPQSYARGMYRGILRYFGLA